MDEIAPEYDVVVLGTGSHCPLMLLFSANFSVGLTECVLSGWVEKMTNEDLKFG